MSDSGPADSTPLTRLAFELSLLARHFPAALLRRPGFQLDRSAYLILTRLELDAPLSLRELSEAFQLDISTINRQVGAMLKQGLVDRVPDPDGGIARKIRASAKGRIINVDIDESLLQPSEKQMVEDLIAAAINDARAKADQAASVEMQKITSGLPLPPGFKMPF